MYIGKLKLANVQRNTNLKEVRSSMLVEVSLKRVLGSFCKSNSQVSIVEHSVVSTHENVPKNPAYIIGGSELQNMLIQE